MSRIETLIDKIEELSVDDNILKITFNTNSESIKYNTFNKSLDSINSILNQINQQYNICNLSNWEIEYRISNINKCCIEIITYIQPILPLAASMFSQENIEFIKTYGSALLDLFKLKKIFKNEELPSSIVNGNVQNSIIDNKGTVIINQQTYNIYSASPTKEAFSKLYGNLGNDNEIISFMLEDSNSNSKIENEKNEFKELSGYKNKQEIDSITIHGLVTNLRSDNPDGVANIVIIKGVIDNVKSKVVARFKSDKYKMLIDAHKQKRLITLVGIGIKQKTQYKIHDVLSVYVH